MSKKLITACMALFALAAFVLPATASASPEVGETKTAGVWTKLETSTGECTAVKGTICVVGNNVAGTNTKLLTDPSGETVPTVLSECTTAKLTAYLLKNTGTEVEATIHTATFSGEGEVSGGMKECKGFGSLGNMTPTTNGGGVDGEKVTNGTPWCLKATNKMNADEFQISGGDCGAEPEKITFILDTTKLFEPTKVNECKYERAKTEPVKGTFTTDTTSGEDLGKDAILSVKPGKTEAEKAKTTFKGEAGNSIECPATGTLEMSFTLETDNASKEPIYIR